MNIFLFFGYLSGVISVLSFVPYIRDILLKKTIPERASWIIWITLNIIAFFSQLSKGANNSLWLPGTQTLGVLIIVILSVKNGIGGFIKRDILSMFLALFGVILWFFTKEPLFALFIVIFVDLLGAILTIIKSYQDPGSETLTTWVLASVSGLLSAFSVGYFNWMLLIYPIYFFTINLAIVITILKGRKKILRI